MALIGRNTCCRRIILNNTNVANPEGDDSSGKDPKLKEKGYTVIGMSRTSYENTSSDKSG